MTYILFNPKAGNNTAEKKAEELKTVLKGKEITVKDITKITDMADFVRSLGEDDEIVLCGGDGMLNRFANDVYDIDVKNNVYLYPAGTGNDFYRDVCGKDATDPVKVNEYIVNLPTVKVNGKTCRFVNGIGYGIDGYCCEVGDKMREKSDKPVNYTSIAIKGLLFHYKPTDAEIEIDGKKYSFKKVWLAPTMNGRMYGGGMIAAPDQKRIADDRKLTVMVMSGSGKIPTLIAFPTIFEGKHVEKKMTSTFTGKKIKVKFNRPTALQIDGETVLGVTEYEAEI